MAKKNTNDTTKLAPVIPIDTEVSKGSYKVDDWVYYAFTLFQVKKLNEAGDVVEISDGNQTLSPKEGTKLEPLLIPLTTATKAASDLFNKIAEEFSLYSASVRLNVAAVFEWLVARWNDYLAASDKDAREAVLKEVNRLRQTVVGVINEVRKVQFNTVAEVKEGEKSPSFQLFA